MFGRNFEKLKKNSALKAVLRVKHCLKFRSLELQWLSCRNHIVTDCCSSAGRTTGRRVLAQRLLRALMQRSTGCRGALPATARRPQRTIMIQSQRIWR